MTMQYNPKLLVLVLCCMVETLVTWSLLGCQEYHVVAHNFGLKKDAVFAVLVMY